MRVLIACEESGTVREAFRRLGHDAVSCDLKPSKIPGPHYQGDVRNILAAGWDLMIGHPDCTFLTGSGARWLDDQPPLKSGKLVGAQRRAAQQAALAFTLLLYNAPIKRIALENPVGALSTLWKKPTQIIHPYEYGHLEQKTTCLWLKNLPKLRGTHNVYAEMVQLPAKERQRIWYLSGDNRAEERSVTFQGIADAMAHQWGSL